MSLHREDRELQIRLAELQADVQIYTTATFAIFAGFLAFMIGVEQVYHALPEEKTFTKNLAVLVILISAVLCVYSVRLLMKRVFKARSQMKELRRQYVW